MDNSPIFDSKMSWTVGGARPHPSAFSLLSSCSFVRAFQPPGPQMRSEEWRSTLLQTVLMNSLAHCTRASVSTSSAGRVECLCSILNSFQLRKSEFHDEGEDGASVIGIPFQPLPNLRDFGSRWTEMRTKLISRLPLRTWNSHTLFPSAAVYTAAVLS